MSTDAILNQSEPNVILTAHVATKVNRTEPSWTEPQTCLACQNHAFIYYANQICLQINAHKNDNKTRTSNFSKKTPEQSHASIGLHIKI